MSAPYPARWECDVVLADGGTAHVRPVRPEDETGIAAFHQRLSPESIQMRFFSTMPVLKPHLMRRFTHVDYETSIVLLALLGDRIIAIAMYHERREAPDEVDAAFVVEDAHQGRGIGTLMLEHLLEIAREQGYRWVTADTLPQNKKMLHVFRDSGLEAEKRREHGIVHLRFPIPAEPATAGPVELREHQGESRSVGRLLSPRTVAVIGIGDGPRDAGRAVYRNLKNGGFEGTCFAVQAGLDSLEGGRVYPDLDALPEEVDLAIVCTPPEQVEAVVAVCAEVGVHGVVIVTGGFAETGGAGRERERALVNSARGHGMRVVGPNCMGISNTAEGVHLHATTASALPPAGSIGFLSQSGGLALAVLERARALGVGFSSFASVGNKADVSGNDLLQFWEEDRRTQVIALALESVGNPRKFSRIARRVSHVKPIVAMKSGRSRAGLRGAESHTAAAPSPDTSIDALFAQTGVIRVDTFEELLDTARVLALQPLPGGPRVAIVSNAGGPAVLAADAAEHAGLAVPELSDITQKRLLELAPGAAVANPVDLAAIAAAEWNSALRTVAACREVDALLVIVVGEEALRAEIADVASGDAGIPVVAALLGGSVEPVLESPLGVAVPCFAFPEAAARALGRCAAYSAWRLGESNEPVQLERIDLEHARRTVAEALHSETEVELESDEAAALLACVGIETGAAVEGERAQLELEADEEFGPLLSLASAGGRVFRILPLRPPDAAALVQSTSAAGAAPLEELVLRIATLAEAVPEIVALHVDLRVNANAVEIAGARVRLAPYLPRPDLAVRRFR
jgi:acyl-CoA synthetase (NDP forming)/GNAT superfamily N-acetyltransferase